MRTFKHLSVRRFVRLIVVGVVAAGTLIVPAAGAGAGGGTELLVNGSFETGDFTGWTTVTTGEPFAPWQVSGAGAGGGFGFDPTEPQDGSLLAWNGFDGGGPMEFLLFQDVTIPSGTAELTWSDRFQWDFGLGGFASLPRTGEVQLRDPGDDSVIATLFSFSTGTQADAISGDSGWQSHAVDVTPYAGGTVRLTFIQTVPQPFTGPAQFELDGVSLLSISKAGQLAGSGVPGKGIDEAPGLQGPFNPNSAAAQNAGQRATNAGQRATVEVCHAPGNGRAQLIQVTDQALYGHLGHGDSVVPPDAIAEVSEVEPNNSIADAQPLDLAPPQDPCGREGSLRVDVDGSGDGTFDYYSFSVDAGATVEFETTVANFDTELVLYDAAGNVLAFDDDGGVGLLSRISFSFTTAGTYAIGVGEFNTIPAPGGMIGNTPDPGDTYTLTISR